MFIKYWLAKKKNVIHLLMKIKVYCNVQNGFIRIDILLAFLLSVNISKVNASGAWHGVLFAETQDFIDPAVPGNVKAYNLFYKWYTSGYGWTGLDYVFVASRTRSPGGITTDIETAVCGSLATNAYNCSGPGSDVWVLAQSVGQWITSRHEYDNNVGLDSDWVSFFTGYLTPLAGTQSYYSTR